MGKARILLAEAIVLAGVSARAGNTDIAISFKQALPDTFCITGYFFGEHRLVYDTLPFRQHTCRLKRKKALNAGVYFAYLPASQKYVEFIVPPYDQQFSLIVDTSNPLNVIEVKGSVDNSLFYEYNRLAMAAYRDTLDSLAPLRLRQWIDQTIKEYPDLFYTRLLRAMQEPDIPDSIAGNDTLVWRYYYEHFLDNVDLSDPALLRTPILHNKVTFYLDKVVPLVPDSHCRAALNIIRRASGDSLTYQYWASTLLNKYANHKLMGMDWVYVCIVDSVYAAGKAWWVDSTTLKRMLWDAGMLRHVKIGKKAPPLILQDTAGRWFDLYSLQADYTVILFWDPECGHCQREMPNFYRVWEKFKDKNVQFVAVYVADQKEKWLDYIRKHHLTDWIHLADINYQSNFRYTYHVVGTPRVYLLDRDKKIIAKQITASQLEEILTHLISNQATETNNQ